jgi:hypothetical protein
MIGKCLHNSGIENKQMVELKSVNGLNFFAQKSKQEPHDMLYVEIKDGYMFGVGNIYSLDSVADKLSEIDLHVEIEKMVNSCLETNRSVFLGYAEYLGRLPEALENNKKVYERQQQKNAEREAEKARRAEEQRIQDEKDLLEAREAFKQGEKIDSNMFLKLCDIHGIKIAIKTRGWIINSLNAISYNSYSHYGNNSTKISGIALELKNILIPEEAEAV